MPDDVTLEQAVMHRLAGHEQNAAARVLERLGGFVPDPSMEQMLASREADPRGFQALLDANSGYPLGMELAIYRTKRDAAIEAGAWRPENRTPAEEPAAPTTDEED